MKWKCDSDSKRDRELYKKQKLREKFDSQPERSKREDESHPVTSSFTESQYDQFMRETDEYMGI